MNWLSLAISISANLTIALACSRVPPGSTEAKSPASENYVLSISGNPQTYVPGKKYNVSIIGNNDATFTSFMLGGIESQGSFEIIDLAETRYTPSCANLVENTKTNVKNRVDVVWVAPAAANMGCVLLRATVVQHRDVWFMDDGFLTKKICEENVDDIDIQPRIEEPCCACNEAKYELTFEEKWSSDTHPKDFPANSWQTRFSDIIGASHTADYFFWRYGELASEGLREVAEHGSIRSLKRELKEQSDLIRSLIKARRNANPNIMGKKFAVFRVDSKHHLISLVSKIDPSPDWIVGVSGLELCLPNCTWVENKVLDLYPWDVGTDSGPSYTSADQPQLPPDVIRRIKPNFTNDPRSPFYDPSGAPMKPFATLHLNRKRLYERTCDNNENENEPPECDTLSWSRWSECSAQCGPGKRFRTREFKNPSLARRFRCRSRLRMELDCTGIQCNLFDEETAAAIETEDSNIAYSPETLECAVSQWSDWSMCSVSCGIGTRIRTRHYISPRAKQMCQQESRLKLQEQLTCKGIDCGSDISGLESNTHGGNENQLD